MENSEKLKYKQKMRLCKKLGAEKFQKVVFEIEKMKFKILKTICPNFIKYFDKYYDFQKKRDNTLKTVAVTAISSATTVTTGACMNSCTKKQIYEKYATAYVDSLSDEELEEALQKMNLLAEKLPETNSKTI